MGGRFAPALKKAGWDILLVKGKAEKPVWLRIEDDQVSIEDASAVWGKEISDTEEYVKEKMGEKGAQVASIGPAGENLVLFFFHHDPPAPFRRAGRRRRPDGF